MSGDDDGGEVTLTAFKLLPTCSMCALTATHFALLTAPGREPLGTGVCDVHLEHMASDVQKLGAQAGVDVAVDDRRPDAPGRSVDALPPPNLAAHNAEILRAWVCGDDPSERDMRVTLRATCFSPPDDPARGVATWGVALADIARHIANALEDCHDVDPGIAVAQIQSLFNAELAEPTDTVKTTRAPDDDTEGG